METVLGTRNSDARTHIERLNAEPERNTVTPEQFEELKAMLQQLIEMSRPGYELCMLHLAQFKAQQEAQAAAPANDAPSTEEPPPAA